MANQLTIDEMHELAQSRNGRCLSDSYVNKDSKLTWQCSLGHVWDAIPRNIRKGSWCPICAVSKRAMKSIKGSLEEMVELANKMGGRCLSTAFIDKGEKLIWECTKGHVWEALPYTIEKGHWCPSCSGNKKLTIDAMRQLAHSRNGKCISTSYINSQTKLTWVCAQGHRWEAVPSSVKSGKWCAVCSGRKKGSMEDMELLAESNGGECLSSSYTNNNTKLVWKCDKAHVWEDTPANVKLGKWCKVCSGEQITIATVQQIASDMGGHCLSNEIVNVSTKLIWECKEGHTWEAPLNKIINGKWCPRCNEIIMEQRPLSRLRQKAAQFKVDLKKIQQKNPKLTRIKQTTITINLMHDYAHVKGGLCLSTEYKICTLN